jgi:hypothetical protein
MILIGGVLGIVGVAIAVLAFLTRPRIMDVASYPPVAALQLWESLKLGVDAPPSVVERAMFLSLQQHHRWTVAGLIMSVLGVLVMAASLPLGRRSAPLTALVFGGGLAGLLLA